VGLVLVGLGVAGLAAGATFGGLTFSSVNKAKGECDTNTPPKCSQDGLDFYRSADKTATVSDIAFAAGGAVFVTGIVVFAHAPSRKPETAALRGSPWVGPGVVGASFGGAF